MLFVDAHTRGRWLLISLCKVVLAPLSFYLSPLPGASVPVPAPHPASAPVPVSVPVPAVGATVPVPVQAFGAGLQTIDQGEAADSAFCSNGSGSSKYTGWEV